MDGKDQRGTRYLVEIEIQQQVAQLSRIFADVRAGIRPAIRGWIDALAVQENVLHEFDIGIMAEHLVVNESLSGIGADHQTRYTQSVPVLVHLRRDDIIIKTPPVIPGQESDRTVPIGTLHHGIDQAGGPCLPIADQAVGCSLFGPLGVIQLMEGRLPFFASW